MPEQKRWHAEMCRLQIPLMAFDHFHGPNLWQDDVFGQRAELMAATRRGFPLSLMLSQPSAIYWASPCYSKSGVWHGHAAQRHTSAGAVLLVRHGGVCLRLWRPGGAAWKFRGRSASSRLHICLFADTSASRGSLNTSPRSPLAVAHISSASANTRGNIPPLSKSILENRLSFIVVTYSRTARRFHFPFDSRLSDGFLKPKPSLSAAALISPYQLTIH